MTNVIITVTLKEESWNAIFTSIRNTRVNSVGNFWTAIQSAEQQVAQQFADKLIEKAFKDVQQHDQ